MRRAEADDQHALLREIVVVIVVRADYGVGRRRLRDFDDERGRVHLRVALVLVHHVARVHAVVARTLRQLQLGLKHRPYRLLVDVHRVADHLLLAREGRAPARPNRTVIIPICRDVLHVEYGIDIRRIDHRNALRLDVANVELALGVQARAREREAHVAHVRRRLGIHRPELRRERLHRHVDRRGRDADVLQREIHGLASRVRRNHEDDRTVRANERRRVVHRRRRHVPRRRAGNHW